MKWGLADQDDAVKQMCKIVSDEKLRDSLSSKSLEKSKEFDWDVILPKIEKLVIDNYENTKKLDLFKLGLRRII